MFILLKSYNFWSTEKENIKIRIKRRAFVNLKYTLMYGCRFLKNPPHHQCGLKKM